jgi:hypothetical protein
MTEQLPKKNGHYTSIKQAAEMLDKDERTIRRWIEDDKLASKKQNGQRLIPLAEVERLRQEMPYLAPSTPEILAEHGEGIETLKTNDQKQDERLEKAEAQIQQLLLLVEQFQCAGAGGGDHPRRRTHQGKGRYYDPALRGLPAGSLRLSDFVAKHQMQRHELEKLHTRGEISMTLHQMQGTSGRYEWWLTPEQQQQALACSPQQSGTPGTSEAPALSD